MALDDHVRAASDRVLTDVRAPLDASLRALAQSVASEVRATERRLAHAMRLFDETDSMGDVLRVLSDSVWREVDRSAVFLVERGRLRGWHCSGFTGARADATAMVLSPRDSGLIGTAVELAAPVVSLATAEPTTVTALPSFAQGAGLRDAAAVPLVLGGVVAAVVYADDSAAGDTQVPWVSAVELLARYAALLLEARTARYLTGVSTASPPRLGSEIGRHASGGEP